jgi:hypothetical protein
MSRYILLIGFSTVLLSSCSTTTNPFSTEHENAWFIMHESGGGDSFPVYCMANKKEKDAEPICYKSKNIGFDAKKDEQSKPSLKKRDWRD